MVTHLIEVLSHFTTAVILQLGYGGIALLMAIESACIPLPSEIIMPFAGAVTVAAIAATHGAQPLNLWLCGLAGAIGCNLGSIVAYWIGSRLGRPFLEKTRWVRFFVTPHELDLVDGWFQRQGAFVVFAARLLPVVRTFIALPAGIARMPLFQFHLYTFLGSLPWCLGLAYVGAKLGQNTEALRPWFHRFDLVIGLVLVAAGVYFVRSRIIAFRSGAPKHEATK